LRMAVQFKGEYTAVREMRRPIAWYLKGVPRANRLKQLVQRLDKAELVAEALMEHLDSLGAQADEPVRLQPPTDMQEEAA